MDMQEIYQKIARKYHVSVEDVERDMQDAINQAWANPNKTREMKARQDAICGDRTPTTEEFIRYIANRIDLSK